MKTNSPTHEEIALHAYEIWRQAGSPEGRDDDIWLEAERKLKAGGKEVPNATSETFESQRVTSESKGAVKLAGKEGEDSHSHEATTAVVEHNVSTPFSEDAAAKAELQKKEARAPQVPVKNFNSKAPLAATGKPLWSQPHSS